MVSKSQGGVANVIVESVAGEGLEGGFPRSGDPAAPREVLRGAYSQSRQGVVGIDWLRFSVELTELRGLEDYLCQFFGESSQVDWGRYGFDLSVVWESCGVSIWYDSTAARSERLHGGICCVEIPGGALSSLCGDDLELLCAGMRPFRAVCRRVDVYFDDKRRRMTPGEIYGENASLKACERSLTSYRKLQYIRGVGQSGLDHDELRLGSRGENGSGRFVRIYDKELESKGENYAVRWEVEFTGDKAVAAFVALSGCNGDLEMFGGVCGALVGGAVKFVERTGEKNLGRLALRDWWAEIVEFLGSVTVRGRKRNTSVVKTASWINRSRAALAMVAEAVGYEVFGGWIRGVIEDGRGRMSVKQIDAIREYRSRGDGLHF